MHRHVFHHPTDYRESDRIWHQFADYVALLVITLEQTIKIYIEAARAFGLNVSLQKTKFLVVEREVQDEELHVAPNHVEGGTIKSVDER